MELELRKYRPEYFDAFVRFQRRAYPDREHPEEYLRYTLSDRGGEPIGRYTSVVLHGQQIVGVNMYLPARVCIGGKTVDILWSFETKVLDEYRESDAGMLLMSEYCGLPNTFSVGLSSIATDLNRRIRSKFIGGSTAFLRPNFRSLRWIDLLAGIVPKKRLRTADFPERIPVGGDVFRRIVSADEIEQPLGSFWNPQIMEFSRNPVFLQWRFFTLPDRYVVYKLDRKQPAAEPENSVYFAVRRSSFRSADILYVVDYRFRFDRPEDFDAILQAGIRLTRKLRLAATYIRSSVETLSPALRKRGFIRKRSAADIVTRLRKAGSLQTDVFVTSADSDLDFK